MNDLTAAKAVADKTTLTAFEEIPWQQELQQAITSPQELLEHLGLPLTDLDKRHIASRDFALFAPQSFIARMQPGNPEDPLLLQVLPQGAELESPANYQPDPLAEKTYNQTPGLVQKYRGRVLLMVAGHCAINCRYCFRRHFPYSENRLSRDQWQQIFEQIAQDSSIREVIYSGGDPLAASDKQLRWLTEHIAAIPHIQRLRIHSRLPVVIPSRIDESCLAWLSSTRLQTVMVIHANHANEIDASTQSALEKLATAGVTLLNQTVLLRGINNHADTLATLSESLFSAGVLPYYLHLFDPVKGASHFDIPDAEAKAIHRQLLGQLPGYLVPKLVREVPHRPSKTLIDSAIHTHNQ